MYKISKSFKSYFHLDKKFIFPGVIFYQFVQSFTKSFSVLITCRAVFLSLSLRGSERNRCNSTLLDAHILIAMTDNKQIPK